MNQSLNAQNIPATFAERGIAMPFTTPFLVQARVRLNRDGAAEFVLPSLSGGKGRYVMSWNGIRRAAAVTLHDRTLVGRLDAESMKAPDRVRRIALEVAARGLAGGRAAAAAQRAVAQEQQYQVLTNFLLVVRLLQTVNLSAEDLLAGGLEGGDLRRRIREALGEVAASLAVDRTDMVARVDTLSALIAPLGLADAPEPGRLRSLGADLLDFQDKLNAWAGKTASDLGQVAGHAAAVAGETRLLAVEAIASLDAELGQIGDLIRRWEKKIGGFTRGVGRLHWLLDGWEYLLAAWRSAEIGDASSKGAMVTEVFRLLPVVPRNEYDGVDAGAENRFAELAAIHRRWVKANEDWRSGRLDYEQVRKIESIRAQMR